MGDHPPITPMRSATVEELGGEQFRLYELITRQFLASLSPDAKYENRHAVLQVGAETFTCSGRKMISPGFTLVLHRGSGSGSGDDDGDYDGENGDDGEEDYSGRQQHLSLSLSLSLSCNHSRRLLGKAGAERAGAALVPSG